MPKNTQTTTAEGNGNVSSENTDATETTTAPAEVEPQLDGANGGKYVVRTWKLKSGTEIPLRLDKAEVRIRLAAPSDNAEQAMRNMLALTGGSVQAVVDQFNGSAALDVQKAAKAKVKADSEATPKVETTVADLQTLADQHVIAPNQRGGGGGGKKAVVAAKAAKLDAVQNAAEQAIADLAALRESDPAAADMQEALMRKLGLLG